MIHDLIIEQKQLEFYVIAKGMTKEEFTLSRKNSFGGSDTSVLLGVNLYTNIDELLKQKQNKNITDAELAIGEKPIVKKGADLEPFILDKAQTILQTHIYKPDATYRFINFPFMTINYDGILVDDGTLIPVEAKLVSKYGEKYYKKTISIEEAKQIDMGKESNDVSVHCKLKANKFGIPAYYYTQVQAEIAGLNAPYGYLIAWFDDSWSGKLYYIKRDDYVIRQIINKVDEYAPMLTVVE